MSTTDGRVATNFITQALNGDPINIYGNGRQTRSFCYIDGLIREIIKTVDSAEPGPINLENPEEFTLIDFSELVPRITGSSSPIVYRPLPEDDPALLQPHLWLPSQSHPGSASVRAAPSGCRTMEWLQSRYYSYGFSG
jgi:nucleoside-diphosphate-sugar epimerase